MTVHLLIVYDYVARAAGTRNKNLSTANSVSRLRFEPKNPEQELDRSKRCGTGVKGRTKGV